MLVTDHNLREGGLDVVERTITAELKGLMLL